MRTTLDIEDDVLYAAKEVARREKKAVGQIVSKLVRRALHNPGLVAGGVSANLVAGDEIDRRFRELGFSTLPSRGGIVTNELINQLREREGV